MTNGFALTITAKGKSIKLIRTQSDSCVKGSVRMLSMKTNVTKRIRIKALPLFILAAFNCTLAQDPPAADPRLSEIRHLDLTYSFPQYHSKDDWLARAESLRKQILFSAGLWP